LENLKIIGNECDDVFTGKGSKYKRKITVVKNTHSFTFVSSFHKQNFAFIYTEHYSSDEELGIRKGNRYIDALIHSSIFFLEGGHIFINFNSVYCLRYPKGTDTVECLRSWNSSVSTMTRVLAE
jgi:hypothetical protein